MWRALFQCVCVYMRLCMFFFSVCILDWVRVFVCQYVCACGCVNLLSFVCACVR